MLSSWLNSPFPHIIDPKIRWATALVLGLIVFLFLSIYKPFGIAEVKAGSCFILGFGGCVATSLIISFHILPVISKHVFNPDSWTIKTEILFHLFNLMVTASLNYLYNSTVGADISPQHSWSAFIYISLAVGIFPIILMVYCSEKYLTKSNNELASDLESQLHNDDKEQNLKLILKSDTESGKIITINEDDFICAQSDNNYCTVYYTYRGETQSTLLRLSLKNLMMQTDSFPSIIRCHKSYAINKSKINRIKGNARSLQLELTDIDLLIPVSRSLDRRLLVS